MKNSKSKGRKVLDPEMCLSLWLELGTRTKVTSHLESLGIINQETKKKFSVDTISRVVWEWVVNNQEKARPIISRSGNINLSDQGWEELMVKRAFGLYFRFLRSSEKFDDWLRRNNLYDKYKNYGRLRPEDLEALQR
ncbi:MAG: hypothetical protein KKD77_20650 [Gammaproteobacteria bacterium]|nr:hypothetical protein [Gammaproteobacteria bacterium]